MTQEQESKPEPSDDPRLKNIAIDITRSTHKASRVLHSMHDYNYGMKNLFSIDTENALSVVNRAATVAKEKYEETIRLLAHYLDSFTFKSDDDFKYNPEYLFNDLGILQDEFVKINTIRSDLARFSTGAKVLPPNCPIEFSKAIKLIDECRMELMVAFNALGQAIEQRKPTAVKSKP